MNSKKHIIYPYLPADGNIRYVAADNPYMQQAKDYSRQYSIDKTMPTGSIIVLDNKVVGKGANGSTYHDEHVCERVRLGIPTGQQYELCEGCSPKNHSEPRAIADALSRLSSVQNADLYLWGHWWCCEPCWKSMQDVGIHTVYLLEDSEILFNKEHPDNIVGKQFAA
nr:Cytidine and deoxycytidylate deaminase zinc-binding region [uncultured bacterium]